MKYPAEVAHLLSFALAAATLGALASCHRPHANQHGAPIHPLCQSGRPALANVTFHGDRARTGWNAAETDLTPDAVGASFGWLWNTDEFNFFTDAGGHSYAPRVHASPLYVDDLPVAAGDRRAVVITATSNAWVYAIAACGADSGTTLWRRRLGTPGLCPKLDGGLPLGVLSTPVADLSTSPPRLYVTSIDAAAGWQVFALDLTTGAVLPGWPLTVEAARLNALDPNGPAAFRTATATSQRGALNLSPAGDYLYIPFASFDDISPGWMVAVDTRRVAVAAAFSTAPSLAEAAEGGIWGPGGSAVDSDGHLFATTGNSDPGPLPGVWGEALLRWSPALALDGTYAPFNHCALDNADVDIGGSSPLILPDLDPAETSTPRLIALGGKQGTVYLLERDRLPGGLLGRQACSTDSTTDGSLLPPGPQPQFNARGPLNVFGPYSETDGNHDHAKMRSTPAYFEDAQGGRFLYVSGSTKASEHSTESVPPSVAKLRVVIGPGQPAYLAVERVDTRLAFVNPGSPIVTSNGAANPVVWVLDSNASRLTPTLDANIPNPILYAMDGTTLAPLWQSPPDQIYVGGKYATPVVAHGFVFVATNRLQAFGLRE